MSSFTIHIAAARVYLNHHPEINEEAFIRGVIAPDLLKKPESHYGPATSSPGLEQYEKECGIHNDYSKGYYLHLKTDLLFYQEFLTLEKFSKEIYNDYDKINQAIIDKYQLEIPTEVQDYVKFQKGNPKFLTIAEVCKFIERVGALELKEGNKERCSYE